MFFFLRSLALAKWDKLIFYSEILRELVIKNNLNKTLLIYRDDGFYGPGWHLPGGIIRFREKVESRIFETLDRELNIKKNKPQAYFSITRSRLNV